MLFGVTFVGKLFHILTEADILNININQQVRIISNFLNFQVIGGEEGFR